MKPLLSIGIRSESTTLVSKYLSGLDASDPMVASVFDLAIKSQKTVILNLVLCKFDCAFFTLLSQETKAELQPLAELDSELSVTISTLKSKTKELNNDYLVLDEEGCEELWLPDEEPTVYQAADQQIKSDIKQQDEVIRNVLLQQEGTEWLDLRSDILPAKGIRSAPFSKFVTQNRPLLEEFYSRWSINENPDNESLLDEIFGDRFDIGELAEAANKAIRESESLEEWIEVLDSFLSYSSKPRLNNFAYNGYLVDLGNTACIPLSSEQETALVSRIQESVWTIIKLLSIKERKDFIEVLYEGFDEKLDNRYIYLNERHKREFSLINDIEYIKKLTEINGFFVKPVSFLDFVKQNYLLDKNVENEVNILNECLHKFQLANLRLVVSEVNKYKSNYLEYYLDIIQEANIALNSAIDKFDPEKGCKFSTYATWWIKQAITRYIDNSVSNVRLPVNMAQKVNKVNSFLRKKGEIPCSDSLNRQNFDEVTEYSSTSIEEINNMFFMAIWQEHNFNFNSLVNIESEIIDDKPKFVSMILNESLLTPKEKKILLKRFGINQLKEHTLEEIGVEFGVTRERIRQIEAGALEKLKRKVRSLGIDKETLHPSNQDVLNNRHDYPNANKKSIVR